MTMKFYWFFFFKLCTVSLHPQADIYFIVSGILFPTKQIHYSQTNIIFCYHLLSSAESDNKQHYCTVRVTEWYSTSSHDILFTWFNRPYKWLYLLWDMHKNYRERPARHGSLRTEKVLGISCSPYSACSVHAEA